MSRLPTTSFAVDNEESKRRSDVARALNGHPIPADAVTIRDLVFTIGQTRDISHGFRRAARGYMAVNARGFYPLLFRTVMADEEEKVQIRLTHSGVSTTTFDLVVW